MSKDTKKEKTKNEETVNAKTKISKAEKKEAKAKAKLEKANKKSQKAKTSENNREYTKIKFVATIIAIILVLGLIAYVTNTIIKKQNFYVQNPLATIEVEKVSELEDVTSTERADDILAGIVDRNKPVEIPKEEEEPQTTNTTQYTASVYNGTVASVADGTKVWPTVYSRINCDYLGYYGHNGVDIGGASGTPIYAYMGGTVTFSGWDTTGYGNCIKISHGNGLVTIYAHCSALYVSAGQQVSAGQTIAGIGMTGWATGNHLHFEVRVNGVPVNPWTYLNQI